jgi:hypothetical protein
MKGENESIANAYRHLYLNCSEETNAPRDKIISSSMAVAMAKDGVKERKLESWHLPEAESSGEPRKTRGTPRGICLEENWPC